MKFARWVYAALACVCVCVGSAIVSFAGSSPAAGRVAKHGVVVKFRDRVGNQLFQTASALGIARRHNTTACFIDTVFDANLVGPLLETMPLERCPAYTVLRFYMYHFTSYRESGHNIFDMPREMSRTTHVGPLLQSFKYFAAIDTHRVFRVRPDYVAQARRILRRHTTGQHTVGIHVRRTDQIAAGFLNVPSAEYFEAAVAHFVGRFRTARFFVLSDDVAWCRRQRVFADPLRVTILETGDALLALTILAECRHMVVSLGTFGWWGAFLGAHQHHGEVVYSSDEFNMQHPLNVGTVVRADYYPPTWTMLLGRGAGRHSVPVSRPLAST